MRVTRGGAAAMAVAMTARAPKPAAGPVAAGAPPATATASPSTPPLPQGDADHRRRAIAGAIGRLPHVRSATWPAPSTLQVVVDSEQFDPRERLCPLILEDPDLGASRLQVQYPTSRERPVRFLQCRAY